MAMAPVPRSSPIEFDQFQSTRYFAELDGLRAVSVLLVATFHDPGRHFTFLAGEHGVQVFFVLSGFLITTLTLREQARGRFSLRAFYGRRIFRIVPLYLIALLTYTFLILVLHMDPRRRQFVAALPFLVFYMQEGLLARGNTPFLQSWSLGIEEKFYLVWPALAFRLITTRRPRAWLVVVLIVAVGIGASAGRMSIYIRPYLCILAGCALALVLNNPSKFERMRRAYRFRVVPCGATLLAIAVSLYTGRIPRLPAVSYDYALALALTLFIAAIILVPSMFGALSNRHLVHLGRLSYAFYLFHQLGIDVAQHLVPAHNSTAGDLASWALGLALTVVGAEVLHRYVEVPLIGVGRRLSEGWRHDSGRPSAA